MLVGKGTPGLRSQHFDLSRIDTPAEALLSPWINPFLRLASSEEATRVESGLEVGDDTVEFSLSQSQSGPRIEGCSNGQAFQLEFSDEPPTLGGSLPGGELYSEIKVKEGTDVTIVDEGQVGEILFRREIIFPQDGPDLALIQGEFDDQRLESSVRQEGQDWLWSGHLGELEFSQLISFEEGGALARGYFGDDQVEQWLSWSR